MMCPSHFDAIATLWLTIEQFADLPSTVAVAQTCRAMHGQIVDVATRRIKVSQFKVSLLDTTGPWERIPNYIPRALNTIHWPSLRSVDLYFNRKIVLRSDGEDDIDNGTSSCFPLFVAQLAYAHNLERLQLDVTFVLRGDGPTYDDEDFSAESRNAPVRYEPLIELLGHNLARCSKLEDIGISHGGYFCSLLMRRLLRGLTPVLEKQRNVLSRVHFNVGLGEDGDEEDEWLSSPTRESFNAAAINFFEQTLSCNCLSVLEIIISDASRLRRALLSAAGQIQRKRMIRSSGTAGESSLKSLWISINAGTYARWFGGEERPGLSEDDLAEAKQLLEIFADCSELEDLQLELPCEMWNAQSNVVASMLRGKSKLSSLDLCFGDHCDENGNVLELLRECAIVEDQCKFGELRIHELRSVDGKGLFRFLQNLKSRGGVVDDYFSVRHRTANNVGKAIDRGTREEDIPENSKVEANFISVTHEENIKQHGR